MLTLSPVVKRSTLLLWITDPHIPRMVGGSDVVVGQVIGSGIFDRRRYFQREQRASRANFPVRRLRDREAAIQQVLRRRPQELPLRLGGRGLMV
jgi:hypothetical protein